jgi:Domain of unknown function (DUF397)
MPLADMGDGSSLAEQLARLDPRSPQWETPEIGPDGQKCEWSTCVRVHRLPGGAVAVGDSKNPAKAPHGYSAAEWKAFTDAVKAGQFD